MRILLIEDDLHTGEVIQNFLKRENLNCDLVTSAAGALEFTRLCRYELLIVDIGLPDSSGHELLQQLRNRSVKCPILILSGYQSTQDKVRALGYGADDYMTKPFVSEELIVRIKALLRRAEGHSSSIITVGELQLNLEARVIEVRGKPMALTEKEYQILEFLLLRKGATLTKNNFLNRLYSGMDEPEAKIIDVFMCKIRKKLEDILGPSGRDYIETIWGRGYVLREPPQTTANSNVIPVNTPHNVTVPVNATQN